MPKWLALAVALIGAALCFWGGLRRTDASAHWRSVLRHLLLIPGVLLLIVFVDCLLAK
jgi:ABC-type antimicrobial peptide transport system permease subunit